MISCVEGELTSSVEALIGDGSDFIGIGIGSQSDNVLLDILNASWAQIEARIPNRYIRRPFECVVRIDWADEMVRLPFHPVTVTEAARFDSDTGAFGANEAPLVPSFEPGSFVLPAAAVWRLSGTAGPDVPQPPPYEVILAVRRLVSASFSNRGDVPGGVDLVWTGALEPIKHMVRV